MQHYIIASSNPLQKDKDRTAAEKKFVASRPAAGGESCNAGFYFQFDYSAAVSLSLSEELSSAEDSVDSESLLDSSDSFFASSSA